MSEKHQSCPKCNKESIAEILWGYYEVTDEMNEALEKKEIILGGCLITDHDPKWICNSCHHRWGERED